MDKYADELEKAYREARAIPSEYIKTMSLLRFVGTMKLQSGDEHYYYCNDNTKEYYYDTDYARRFRARMKTRYK